MTNGDRVAGVYVTQTESDTAALGQNFGAQLSAGAVVLLSGQLGAGKTVFVRGVAAGLSIDPEAVHSPSFTLVNFYPAKTPLYHIDLYRLDPGAAAAYAVDLDEILQNEDAIVVIEWAERLGNFPLPPHWTIEIVGDGDEPRRIGISGPDSTPSARSNAKAPLHG